MATAVLDIDLEHLPPTIEVADHYKRAFILLRYQRRPVGRIVVPVTNGCLIPAMWREEILDACGSQLWKEWLAGYLKKELGEAEEAKVYAKASIAICTRDRTDDLKRCLDALMKLPDDGQEILVIDNNPSNNNTQQLVERYPGVRYILEKRGGLNIARNRALREAVHDLVAFTDDDAVPDEGWLRGLVKNFDSPLVACVTGITLPLELETEAQEAFESYSPFNKGFVRRVFSSDTNNPLNTGDIGAGANMAFRKSLQARIGWFDEALDAGTITQSGGDHEYFSRVLLAGYHIVYEPGALSWHRHRRSYQELYKAVKGYGVGVYAYWTRLLFIEREWGTLKLPIGWFVHSQWPMLKKALLRRPGHQPLDLVLAELKGCWLGPWAYFSSRRRLKRKQATA